MWPFSHKARSSEEIPEAFHERLKSLESDVRLLRTEWHEVYDKLVHSLDRERKRKAKLVAEALEDPPTNSGKTAVENWNDPVFIMSEARKRGL